MRNELPETDLQALLLLLLGKRKRFKVVGQSMSPLLRQGEEILINPKAYNQSSPKINDVVVTIHPHNSRLAIVKRVKEVAEDDSYFLIGDNPEKSTDSRHWGKISRSKIIGKVTNRFI